MRTLSWILLGLLGIVGGFAAWTWRKAQVAKANAVAEAARRDAAAQKDTRGPVEKAAGSVGLGVNDVKNIKKGLNVIAGHFGFKL